MRGDRGHEHWLIAAGTLQTWSTELSLSYQRILQYGLEGGTMLSSSEETEERDIGGAHTRGMVVGGKVV